MGRILVVDDEEGLRRMLAIVLGRDGHQVAVAASGADALERLAAEPAEVVLTDLRMDGMDGLALLARVRAAHPDTVVAVMTAHAEWDTAVQAMRQGAFTFLRKPFDNAAVRSVVARACHARDRLVAARSAGEHPHTIHLVGASAAVQRVQHLIEQVATSDATVLVLGESGTGKELVARAVHYASLRADGPMVRVNAGALAPGLLESELFGHVKGAFTGAIEDRPGLFALADRGTLFLDEVGELAPETQVKLLRILESGEYLPVGGREVRRCDVRIVAATNRDLAALVQDGSFREDLYYRLAVVPIELPPLRDRREDIPLLAGHLLARHAVKLRRGVSGFAAEALLAMESWPWPGNIRELDNRIQRGVALTPEGLIQRDALFGLDRTPAPSADRPGDDPEAGLRTGGTLALEDWLQTQERRMLAAAIEACDGNLTAAAERLGLTFRQIRYKVRQLGMR